MRVVVIEACPQSSWICFGWGPAATARVAEVVESKRRQTSALACEPPEALEKSGIPKGSTLWRREHGGR